MGDYSMSEAEISALKDTLHAQQQLLQKLYNELEAEREASATAANEALSVILRLQGEKAAVKMEAEQYKRLSEEKIYHAEESLAIIEDVICQKEMEVAALDHQVQAYRYKLLSMGCIDPGFGDSKFHDNAVQRNENLAGETSLGSMGRRHSAPVSIKYKKAISERDGCCVPETDSVSRNVEEKTGQEMFDQALDSGKKADNSTHGGISSYWEQIRKLDVRVREITGANYTNSRSETRSPSPLSSRISSGNPCDLPGFGRKGSNSCEPSKVATSNETDQTKSSESRNGVAVDSSCSTSIHDVFEVPQIDENLNSRESPGEDKKKIARQGSGKLEKEGVVHPEAVKMCARDEPGWLKKVLQYTHGDKKLCQPSNIDCHLVAVEARTSMSESHPMLNQVNSTSEIEEVDRPAESTNREEELRLLNEIKEKMDSLHDEIRSWKVKKSSTRVEPSLSVLSEAMLYFWL